MDSTSNGPKWALDLSASFGAALDKHGSHLDKSVKRLAMGRPFFWRYLYQEIAPTGGGIFNAVLGNPDSGKCWSLCQVSVFDIDPNTQAFRQPGNLISTAVMIGDSESARLVSGVFEAVPTPNQVINVTVGADAPQLNFSKDTIWQYTTEDLFVQAGFSGASSLKVAARVLEYSIDDVQPRMI